MSHSALCGAIYEMLQSVLEVQSPALQRGCGKELANRSLPSYHGAIEPFKIGFRCGREPCAIGRVSDPTHHPRRQPSSLFPAPLVLSILLTSCLFCKSPHHKKQTHNHRRVATQSARRQVYPLNETLTRPCWWQRPKEVL